MGQKENQVAFQSKAFEKLPDFLFVCGFATKILLNNATHRDIHAGSHMTQLI